MSKIDYNIFLIGFMGAGKSTIARSLVQKLNFPLIEMDERIVKEQGMPISEIFDRYGEEHFRDIESELVKTIGTLEPSVVSCGGGTVLRPENVENMKNEAKFVSRSLVQFRSLAPLNPVNLTVVRVAGFIFFAQKMVNNYQSVIKRSLARKIRKIWKAQICYDIIYL